MHRFIWSDTSGTLAEVGLVVNLSGISHTSTAYGKQFEVASGVVTVRTSENAASSLDMVNLFHSRIASWVWNSAYLLYSSSYPLRVPALQAGSISEVTAGDGVGVQGRTTGAATGSTEIGYMPAASSGGWVVYAANAPKSITSFVLGAGNWLVVVSSQFGNNSLSAPTNVILALGTTADSLTGTVNCVTRQDGLPYQAITLVVPVTISESTTYQVVAQTNATSGNAQNLWGVSVVRIG